MMVLNLVPSVIPRKRIIGALIALLFSSAIFVGTNSVLLAMTNVSSDFFGESEDVIVFYNQEASTPFTSQVSVFNINAFQTIPGVKTVSPEVFQAITIQGQAGYLRGANFSNIQQIDNAKIIKGTISNNPYGVLVGQDLANRFNLRVGNWVQISSIITEENVDLRVTGIYKSQGITNDEIISQIPIAQSIAGFSSNTLTHIRIKYNPNIISESSILTQGTSIHDLTVKTDFGNATTSQLRKLKIEQQVGGVIYNEPVASNITIPVNRGNYHVSVLEDSKISFQQQFFIDHSQQVSLDLADYDYTVNISLIHDDIPLQGIGYEIQAMTLSNGFVESGTITNQVLSTKLRAGDYTVVFHDDINRRKFNITILGSQTFVLNWEDYQFVEFEIDLNNSLIDTSDISLVLKGYNPEIDFYLNDTNIPITTQLFADPHLNLNLTDGFYVLEVRERNFNSIVSRYHFQVDSTFEFFKGSLANYHHYSVASDVSLSTIGLLPSSINSSNFNFTLQTDSMTLTLPDTEGYYEIELKGITNLNKQIVKFWRIFVDNTPVQGGWISPQYRPIVISGDTIPIWSTSELLPDAPTTGNIIGEYGSYSYEVPDVVPGNYTDEITSSIGSFFLNYQVVGNYSELFFFKNSTGEYSINNILSHNFTLKYPNTETPYYNQFLWDIYIQWNGTSFTVYPNQTIFTPQMVAGDAAIVIKNLLTGTVENKTFVYSNSGITASTLNFKHGRAQVAKSGRIVVPIQDDITYSFSQNGTEYLPIQFSSGFILPNGTYHINVTFNGFIDSWTLLVPNKFNLTSSFTPFVTLEGQLNSSGLIFSSSVIFYGNSIAIVEQPQLPAIDVEVYLNGSLGLGFANIVKGNYSLTFSNSTMVTSTIKSQEIFIPKSAFESLPDNDLLNISITGFDSFALLVNTSTSTIVNRPVFTANLDVLYTQIETQNITLQLEFTEMGGLYSYFITSENTTIQFPTYLQNVIVTIFSEDEGFVLFQTELVISEFNTIKFGSVNVNFTFYNPNWGETTTNANLVITSQSAEYSLDYSGQDISLNVGNYTVSYRSGLYEGTSLLDIAQDDAFLLNFDIYLANVSISFLNYPINHPSIITLHHEILEFQYQESVTQIGESVSFVNIPVGSYHFLIEGNWGASNGTITLEVGLSTITIEIVGLEEEDFTVDLDKILDGQNASISVGSDYLDSFLQGALRIVQIILLTEFVIIIIIIFMNIGEVFRHVVYESRQELELLKELGATSSQMTFGYSKYIILLSTLVALIGHGIAGILIQLLFRNNQTVFFGHLFRPLIFSPVLIISNLFVITMLSFLTARYVLFVELNTSSVISEK